MMSMNNDALNKVEMAEFVETFRRRYAPVEWAITG